MYSDSREKQPVRDLVRSKIVPQLRKALAKFASDLIAEHGKDIQHGAAGAGPSSATTSTVKSSTAAQTTAKPSAPASTPVSKIVNTVTLTDSSEFQTTAAELYTSFVDAERVTAFTRAPPAVFEAKVGGKFSLFGGNVDGSFVELEKDKKIVMNWRLSTWTPGVCFRAEVGDSGG